MPPELYPPELTSLSERTLGEVLAVVPEAIFIGGWASHFRVGAPRSHDIDLVLQPHELDMLAARWPVTKTTHLGTKWRAEANGIHVDLYVPHQSTLGTRLQLPVSALPPHAVSLEGRRVLDAPAHLATKLAALLDRPDTLPGEKDREEVWLLLRTEAPDPGQVASVLGASALQGSALTAAVDEALGYLRDLPLSRPERAWLRTTSAHVGAAVAELGGADQRPPLSNPHPWPEPAVPRRCIASGIGPAGWTTTGHGTSPPNIGVRASGSGGNRSRRHRHRTFVRAGPGAGAGRT